jgi:hypothetical protein
VPSAPSAICSSPKSAATTSPLPDMDSSECPLL